MTTIPGLTVAPTVDPSRADGGLEALANAAERIGAAVAEAARGLLEQLAICESGGMRPETR